MAEDDRQQPESPGGWLPPEPPGGLPPQPPPLPPPAYQPPPPPQPPAQGPPPPPQGAPPLAAPPPPPYPYAPQQAYPPPHPYAPQPPNNDAVIGFTCAVIGAALLFFTAGFSSVISLILGIVAIPYSRNGKRKIAEGETRKHKDLANSGYIVGIITIVGSILATVAWALVFALVDWDEVESVVRPFF